MKSFSRLLHGGRHRENPSPPRYLKFRSSRLFILITICLSVFTDIFLYGVIIPVIPFAIQERAGVGAGDVQYWTSVLLAVYGGAMLVGSPIAGWVADASNSRRIPFIVGLVALAASTLLLCLGRNVALLITGRLLQGLSAAVVWTVGEALLVDTVGEKEIGLVMGYVGIAMSLGLFVGPLLGGVVYAKAGYYAVFYMCFGLVFLDIVLRLVLIEKVVAVQWLGNEDLPVVAVPPIGESMSGETSTENGHDIGLQKDEPNPSQQTDVRPHHRKRKLPKVFILLASRRLLAALWGVLVQAVLTSAFDSVIPLFVHHTFEWDATAAGLVFTAIIIPTFLGPVIGAWSDRYGPRWLVVAGFLGCLPFWVLLRFVTDNTIQHKVLFCALLVLIGAALTFVISPLMAEITYCVEAMERKRPGIFGKTGAYAQAYGLFVSAFAVGSLIGPLWGGLVNDSAGWGTMTWTLGLFSALAAVPAVIFTGGLITKTNAKSGEERVKTAERSQEATEDPEQGVTVA
jgi:MFS family permease